MAVVSPVPPGTVQLRVNGAVVLVPTGNTVLEALRMKASSLRLGEWASEAAGRPLVFVDGALVRDGVRTLAEMPVCDVEDVQLLRPLDAVRLYGGLANAGAIAVRTRRGATEGQPGC